MTILDVLGPINRRIAYGKDRKVDLDEEVIVITGGRSGLGKCVAEVYALRGATVAVIDVQDAEGGEEVDGISYYNCDVSDGEAVKKTWAQITEEVSFCHTRSAARLKSFADHYPSFSMEPPLS